MTLLNSILEKIIGQKAKAETYFVEKDKIEILGFEIRCHLPYAWLLDIAAEFQDGENAFLMKYSFFEMEEKEPFSLEFLSDKSSKLKSLAHLWKNSSLFEQELYENFGIEFTRAYHNRYHLGHQIDREDIDLFNKANMFHHPSRFVCKVSENVISACYVVFGKFYLNIERNLIDKNVVTSLHFIEDYFSLTSIFWIDAFVRIVEKKQAISVPDRAQALRMVLLELCRILNHLKALFSFFDEVELLTAKSLVSQWIKKIQAILISYSGNEFGLHLIRVGGVTRDVRQDWVSRTINELSALQLDVERFINTTLDLKLNQLAFDYNVAQKSDVSGLNISGPVARVTGLNLDLRKCLPHYFYDDVDFDIPVGVLGSAKDMVRLKLQEIIESARIISQVLDNLPTGPFMTESFQALFLDKELNPVTGEEGYKKALSDFHRFDDVSGSTYFEGPNGMSGLKFSIKNGKIRFCHFITPDRLLRRYFEQKIVGSEVEYLTPMWAGLGVSLKEAER